MEDIPNRLRITRKDGLKISTVKVIFMDWYGPYETAISLDGSNKSWRIAEGYKTEEEAIKGHEKYEKMSREELEKIEWIG